MLVVDDEPTVIAGVLEVELADDDIQVQEIRSGAVAIDAVDDLHPDAMVLDIMMPEVDGFDVLTAVGGKVPTVVLTARADVGDTTQRCLALGARRVLSKPFAVATLAQVVRDLINQPKE